MSHYSLDPSNFIWGTGTIPKSWKQHLLLPILKPNSAASYRPITLSSVPYKIYERLIEPRMEWWMEGKGLLDPQQYGFRKGRSTTDALGLLTTTVQRANVQNKYTAAAFLDIASAYNSVRPRLLLRRLHEAGAPSRVVNSYREILIHQELHAAFNGEQIGPRDLE